MSSMSMVPTNNLLEVIAVSAELTSQVLAPTFQSTLLSIKNQSGVNFISLVKPDPGSDRGASIQVDSPSPEAAMLARQLLDLKFKHLMKLQSSEEKLKKLEEDLYMTQGNIAAGQMVEFEVPQEVIGLIIGKKGARIRQVEEETGVTSIKVNDTKGKCRVPDGK